MPRRMLLDEQPGFSGINLVADESQLSPTQMRSAENARLTEHGAVSARLGTQRTSSAAIGSGADVLGGYSWELAASTEQLAVSNGTLYTGSYPIPITWNAEVGALSSTVAPSFAHFYDGSAEVVYIADGGALNKWDGTTLTVNIASTPNATRIWVYNQRLFGVTGASQTLYWSDLNDGDTLGDAANGGGEAIVRTFGSQALVGGIALGDTNILFHRTGVSLFTGWTQDDISIATGTRGLSQETGTIAPGTIVAVDGAVVFLSLTGVYAITGAGLTPISSLIEPVITGLNQSIVTRAVACHDRANRQILFYLPDEGIYAYNYRLGRFAASGEGWTGPWKGVYTAQTVYSLWPARDDSNKPIVLGGFGDGYVRECEQAGEWHDDVLSDDTGGDDIVMAARCHRMFFRAPTREKSLRRIWVTAEPGASISAGVEWRTGTGSGSATIPPASGAVWGAFNWGAANWGGAGSDVYPLHAHGRGRYVDVTITNDGDATPVFSRVEAQAFDMSERA